MSNLLKRYMTWARYWEISIAMRYEPIRKQLARNYTKETKILEVGAGGAGVTRFFPVPVTSLDIAFGDLTEYDRSLTTQVTASVESIPFPDNHFDVLISVDMFEHLDVNLRKKALLEFFRVTKPDGMLMIAVPCSKLSTFHEKIINWAYKIIKKKEHPWLEEHIKYGLPEWKALLDQIKSVNSKCLIEVQDNVNVFLWFILHNINGFLPPAIRRPIMQCVFPFVKYINFMPYRKFFLIKKV